MGKRWYRTSLEGTYRKGKLVVSDKQLADLLAALTASPGDLVCLDGPHLFERRSHRGPAPNRCPEHAKARKALADRKRRRSPRPPKPAKPLCCQEAGGTCRQHQQQRDYENEQARKRASQVDGLFEILDPGWHVVSG